MTNQKVIIHTDGKNTGPFSWEQVRELLREGKVTETDYVWFTDSTEWITIADALAKFKPPVSLTSRLNKIGEQQDPRSKTNLLQLHAKRTSSLTRPLY